METSERKSGKHLVNHVLLMNFTGAYHYEKFTCRPYIQQIDCSHLSGTDCYCDAEGYQTLKNMIKDYPVYGVHFIDSGNYHYLTKLWTDRLKQPFTLVVFDHHPDMQPSLFE